MPESDQVKPLAPAASDMTRSHDFVDVDEESLSRQLKLRQRKYIKCCGCFTAVFLILAVTVLVLVFTVFTVKDPSINMTSVAVQAPSNGTLMSTLLNGANVTFLAHVSVKNPNVATYRFNNSTSTLYYRGVVVGEARVPAGKAEARRTLRMILTVDVVPHKMTAVPSLASDVGSGALTMSSYTRIEGRVRIMKVIKKFVVVRLNCTVTYNISTQAIQDQMCDKHVRF